LKSTIVSYRLTFLFGNIVSYHLVSDDPTGHSQVATRPQVFTPEHTSEVSKFLEEDSRADPFQSLGYLGHILGGSIGDEHVHVVAGYFPTQDSQFMFHSNLPEQISGAHSYFPS
jgi:hypothetical protein